MRALPDIPIFDRTDARALGWTDSAITRAVRSGRIVALRRGQLTAAGQPDARREASNELTDAELRLEREHRAILAAHAAARARPDSVISHYSAALIHGLPMLETPPSVPALTVAPGTADGAVGAHVHRATLPLGDVVQRAGYAVTAVARTVVDLARSMSTVAALVVLDAALHRHAATVDELDAALTRCWNWPGIRRAIRTVALGDPRSESPLESVSRLVLHRVGLPTPSLQAEICDSTGSLIGRTDFYWDEFGVVGEADGAGKYEIAGASLLKEKERQERVEDRGLVVVRWGWDATRHPEDLRRRVERGFERGLADPDQVYRANGRFDSRQPNRSDENPITANTFRSIAITFTPRIVGSTAGNRTAAMKTRSR
jgi:hypothetical protein